MFRSFEMILGREVVRLDIVGFMGVFGCVLIVKERYVEGEKINFILKDKIDSFKMELLFRRCGKCGNNCLFIINKFLIDEEFILGNRCERGFGIEKIKEDKLFNLYDYKYKRIFNYKLLKESEVKRGIIGILRVLNMYENYLFWFIFLIKLGFSVRILGFLSKKVYEFGIEIIFLELVCYLVKLVYGYIKSLIDRGIKNIFYFCILYEKKEFSDV